MRLKFERKKKRIIINSIIYRISKIIFLSNKRKFEFFSNLDWIINRIAHEAWMNEFAHSEEHPARQYLFRFLKNKIPDQAKVLDLGCGFGEISGELAKICSEVVGIDKNASKIQVACNKYAGANVTFICDDALKYLKSNSQKFDVLILSHILEHLDEPYNLLNEFKEYFDYIYIEVPDFESSYFSIVKEKFNMQINYTDEDHIYEFDRDGMSELLNSLNLQILHSEFRNGVMRYWIQRL